MRPESSDDPSATEIATAQAPPKPRGRGFLLLVALAGAVACGVLGFLLYQAYEREQQLRVGLSTTEYELARVRTVNEELTAANRELTAELLGSEASLRTVSVGRDQAKAGLQAAIVERDDVQASLRETRREREAALASLRTATFERTESQSALREMTFARDNATRSISSLRSELSNCTEALDAAVDAARSYRDKLDEISSAIRIGMIGVADVPSKGFSFGSGFDLESEYRKVVNEYNDLVRRFNAAVERSNDFGEILNRVINILRS